MRNAIFPICQVFVFLFGHAEGVAAAFPPRACTNDTPCEAVDLGTLTPENPLGDLDLGLYDNTCATNTGEPNPYDRGAWYNDAGVWFRFTTGPNPSSLIFIEGVSDPEGTGDPIDLEIAVFRAFSSCTGILRQEGAVTPVDTLDAQLPLFCARPSTTYYILVDGTMSGAGFERGVFSLRVREIAVTEAGDSPCRAEDLGWVPEGGSVQTDGPRGNFCATSFNDPPISSFATQVTVWFQFQAPYTGHVRIEANAEGLVYPLGVQLALLQSSNGRCTGTMTELASIYTDSSVDEHLEARCLNPGEVYFVLVDGFGAGGRGMFTLSVADAGDLTPVTRLDTVLCAGDSLHIGSSVYTQSGNYVDTLTLPTGCDSVVQTRLTILEPIIPQIDQYEPAVWNGAAGAALAGARGGTGAYSYAWRRGETGDRNTTLAAGEDCCLTVTDTRGCRADTCFTVAFITKLLPDTGSVSTLCYGNATGRFHFAVSNGIAPYQYRWQSADGTLQGAGALDRDDDEVQVTGVPAGQYSVHLSDAYGDTSFVMIVTQPPPVRLESKLVEDASCFSVCDGRVQLTASGGTGALRYLWADGAPDAGKREGLCAGAYAVTIADANNCAVASSMLVAEPPEFIVTAAENRSVSCFGGNDGVAAVTTNGHPVAFTWSDGRDSARISGLAAGSYAVTVTNADGCEASARVAITQPVAPLKVTVEETDPVSCYGASDGRLAAVVTGPYERVNTVWTNGIAPVEPVGLPAGIYGVTVTNEKGCRAEARYVLTGPEPIRAEPAARDITCLDSDNGGEIRVQEVSGGRSGYAFSLDGVVFRPESVFAGLFAGAYEVIVRDAAGCEQAFPITIQGPPELFVDLGEDLTIQLGDSIRLVARTNSANPVYSWSPDTLAVAGAASVFVRPLVSGVYKVSVYDTVNYCTASDLVRLTVRRDRKVYIPNAFSPDGDGQNDRFAIFGGKGTERIRTFRIFGRDGALLYEASNLAPNEEDRGWDGRFRGRAMPVGVYVYLAEIDFIDGRTELFRGDVLLVR